VVVVRRCSVLLVVCTLVAASCSGGEGASTTTGPLTPTATTSSTSATSATIAPTPATSTTTTTTTVPPSGDGDDGHLPTSAAFADLADVPLRVDNPAYEGPPTPASIDGIYVPRSMEHSLTSDVVARLEAQGFVVVPSMSALFHPKYQEIHYEGEVHYVTTDVAYHYLHLAFSKVLRDLEQHQLLPILEGLLDGLVDASRRQRGELADTPLADYADRVVQLYEATAVLAGLDVGPIGPRAEAEVELALQAADLAESPITAVLPCRPLASMSGCVDFSLFKPRGHYTRNAALKRYSRAMSVLGNESFGVTSGEALQMAALTARVLVEDEDLLDAWAHIYDPTAFLVGAADDYTPAELAGVLDDLVPQWRSDPTLVTVAVGRDAGRELLDLRPVGIDPDAASVRVMGARFVVDSYIYDQLRFPNVGDPPWGRRYATPLDLVATFGSDLAYDIMEDDGALTDPGTGRHWTNYDSQLAMLAGLIDARSLEDWSGTVYDAWLWSLEPVWMRHGTAYPDYMRSRTWEIKDLQTALGSYTELKHDTILYAKQSYAPEGDYEPVPYPEARHWVEPNPAAFGRMLAVLDVLRDGLRGRALLPSSSDNAALIAALGTFLQRLQRLANEELAGMPISADDNEWLQYIGSTLEALWIRSSDAPDEAGEFPEQDTKAALVADIMRTTSHILELGTGHVDTIYVLVPTDDGRFQIAEGAVYSYYEFWRSVGDGRLTDEEWWQLLDTSPPERPGWQDPLFP
jgi:hypothetical protein